MLSLLHCALQSNINSARLMVVSMLHEKLSLDVTNHL